VFTRSILSNYLGSLAGLGISKGLRFFAVALCVRMVGDFSWGEVVSTMAAFTFVGLLLDQGLGASSLLFRIRDRGADDRLLAMIPRSRAVATVVFLLALHAFHYAVHPLPPLARLYSLVLLPRAFAIDWWFHRRELFQFTLYIGSVRTLLFFLLALAFVGPGASAATVILAEMASETASVGFAWMLRRAAARRREAPGPEAPFGFRELLLFSTPFLAIGLLNAVQVSADVLILKFFFGEKTVAQYDVGARIGFLYFFLGASVIQIIRPKLSRLHGEGNEAALRSVLGACSTLLLLLSAAFLIPSLYFAEPILKFSFGFDQEVSVATFRWAALWVGTTFMTMLCSDTLLSLGKRRRYLQAAALCAGVNIAANLVLLRFLDGHAAIFAKILAELAFMSASLRSLPAGLGAVVWKLVRQQLLVLFAFVATYFAAAWLDKPRLGLVVSLCLLAFVAVRGGFFSRATFAVFRQN
jgi:O-antigen/teichoic acid export membrane protein